VLSVCKYLTLFERALGSLVFQQSVVYTNIHVFDLSNCHHFFPPRMATNIMLSTKPTRPPPHLM